MNFEERCKDENWRSALNHPVLHFNYLLFQKSASHALRMVLENPQSLMLIEPDLCKKAQA